MTKPNLGRLKELDAEILAIEHEGRLPHSDPAIMAFRIGEAIYGTQFHPEAYPKGMLAHFMKPKRRDKIVKHHGAVAFDEMMFHLRDPIKLTLTYEKVLPEFLKFASKALYSTQVPVE